MPPAKPGRMGADVNAAVAGALRDLAAAQASMQSRWGYKRAAASVARLERPLTDLVAPDGTLSRIPQVGPASTRVILEVLASGWSETVERAVAASGRQSEIRRRRELRVRFLSRAEVKRILNLDAPDLVGPSDYRADFQMHSYWSDGAASIDALAEAAMERGYSHMAITDHSKGLPIAGGMSLEAMAAQAREVDALNQRYGRRFRVLKGIECNISSTGTLDLSSGELAGVEMVLAAPHSKLRIAEDQTARLVRAIATPGVHVLAHPRGRMSDSRPGLTADWDEVFAAAVEHDVAIEIDGDPARQDLDYVLAAHARDTGCLFALDSDAHDELALGYAETSIAHARLAGISTQRIINCWPLEQLLEWLRAKSGAGVPGTRLGRRVAQEAADSPTLPDLNGAPLSED
jgi:histidinol phosphatase-like PHP family hydrolase